MFLTTDLRINNTDQKLCRYKNLKSWALNSTACIPQSINLPLVFALPHGYDWHSDLLNPAWSFLCSLWKTTQILCFISFSNGLLISLGCPLCAFGLVLTYSCRFELTVLPNATSGLQETSQPSLFNILYFLLILLDLL